MNILTIGGSDPSSGAGIQSDIKTFDILGAYGFSVITAITSQNTEKFAHVGKTSSQMVKSQLRTVFSDFEIDVIKIGMVYDSSIIKSIHSILKSKNTPIIVDPVIESTTGGILLKKNAIKDFRKYLLPISYIITPNIFEAEKLSGIKIKNKTDLKKCAKELQLLGAQNVIITGYQSKKKISDFIFENSKQTELIGSKLAIENHGSGCNFSAALSVGISEGKNIVKATRFAKKFVYNSILNSKKIGKGLAITFSKNNQVRKILNETIQEICRINKFSNLIPECQTNFVFSQQNPKSVQNIFGVRGRIVKTGNTSTIAGTIELGGSKHVATAVLEINKKFPEIRSAINIRFTKKNIQALKNSGLVILEYDRRKEPLGIKKKENSTISWGIKECLKKAKVAPDVIFHKGDFGKEPMILIFGKDPSKIIEILGKSALI